MKKTMSMLLAFVMVFGLLAGCNNANNNQTNDTSTQTPTATAGTSTNTETPTSDSGNAETTATADGPFAPYEKEVTITAVLSYRDAESDLVPKDTTVETNAYVKLFKEQLNINLEFLWIVNSDQYEAKMGATIASGELPDIFQPADQKQYVELRDQGAFAEIGSLFDQYASEATHAFFDPGAEYVRNSENGNMHAMVTGGTNSYYTGNSVTYYRKDWLDQLGLTVPTTMAELEAVMDAFQKADLGGTGGAVLPSSSIDVNGLYGNGFFDFTPVFTAYGAYYDVWLDDNNGGVYTPFIAEEGRAAITKLNEWYQKGYINKDFASLNAWDAANPAVEDLIAGKYGIVMGSWWVPAWPLNLNRNNQPEAEWVAAPVPQVVPGKDTFTVINQSGDIGAINAISASCKNPEAVIKLMNLFIEAQLCASNPSLAGTEKENWGKPDYGYVYNWIPFKAFYGDTLIENYTLMNKLISEGRTELNADEQAFNSEFFELLSYYKKYVENPNDGEAWGRYYSRIATDGGLGTTYWQQNNYEVKTNLYDVSQVYDAKTKYGSSMSTLTAENMLKMIMGEIPLSDWDKFVDQWKSIGGEALQQEVLAKLNR